MHVSTVETQSTVKRIDIKKRFTSVILLAIFTCFILERFYQQKLSTYITQECSLMIFCVI